MNDITQSRAFLSSIGAPGKEPGPPQMLNAPGPSGEISGQFGPKPLFRPRQPSPQAHAVRHQHLASHRSPSSPSLSPSTLLQPVPLPRTPPSPSFLPLPPPGSCRLRSLVPHSPPPRSPPPRPSRTDFAGPGVSACGGGGQERGQRGEEPGSAGHGGRRSGQHAGVRRWRVGAGLAAPPRRPTGCSAFSPAGLRLSLVEPPSLSSTRRSLAASLSGRLGL